MADVKWIKIAVDIFDNRKIKQIETMPDGESLLIIWFKLLCLAGNVNDGGLIYLTKEIPYTDEMLATQFNKPLANVRLALKTFEAFGMVEIINNIIYLSSWEKYQNTDKLAEIREQTRKRVAKHREKVKALEAGNGESSVTGSVTVTDGNATDIDKNKNIDKDNISKDILKKPARHKYGNYNNVLLSDDDLEKLKSEFPKDWDSRIERLSEYIAISGKSYKNHLATIRSWARKEKPAKGDYEPPKDNLLDLLGG